MIGPAKTPESPSIRGQPKTKHDKSHAIETHTQTHKTVIVSDPIPLSYIV